MAYYVSFHFRRTTGSAKCRQFALLSCNLLQVRVTSFPGLPLLLLFWPGNKAKVRDARRHFYEGKKSAVWLPLDHLVALWRYLASSHSEPVSLSYQDNDNRVREASHHALKSCAKTVKNALGPHLRSIIGCWVSGMCDPHGPAASAAQNAFASTFPLDKQREVFKFGLKAIFAVSLNS